MITAKVYVRYEDGHYWLEAYTTRHQDAGLIFTEISSEDWENYQAFEAEEKRWHDYIRELDNIQFERENPDL